MSYVPPGMIEHQLVLVRNVCKAVCAHIKIRKAYYLTTLHLRATLSTVSNLKIWRRKYAFNFAIRKFAITKLSTFSVLPMVLQE